jgi:hypothetical protein
MNKSIPHLFTEVTALLEDMHGIAVEGQRRDNPPEVQLALADSLTTGFTPLETLAFGIVASLRGQR